MQLPTAFRRCLEDVKLAKRQWLIERSGPMRRLFVGRRAQPGRGMFEVRFNKFVEGGITFPAQFPLRHEGQLIGKRAVTVFLEIGSASEL